MNVSFYALGINIYLYGQDITISISQVWKMKLAQLKELDQSHPDSKLGQEHRSFLVRASVFLVLH